MATKKQRRRRAKEHRHDYVWVDESGNEIDAPDEAPENAKQETRSGRGLGRDPQEPSWQRSFRRGAIFAPIMFGTVFLLSPNLPLATKVTQTLLIVGIFIPFSYFLDRFFHRSFRRRADREQSAGRRRG